jgi:hypothetical protein
LSPVIVAFFRGEIGEMLSFKPQEEAKAMGTKGDEKKVEVKAASPKKKKKGGK